MEENNCKYICSMGFRKSCDLYTLLNVDNVDNYDFSKVKYGDLLYIKTDAINNFSKIIDKIKTKFVLISGCSDYSVPYDRFSNETEFINFIENDKIIHYYAQNCTYKHKKITLLPIGMDYHSYIYCDKKKTPIEQENDLIAIKNNSKHFSERHIKIYSNCHFFTNTKFGRDRVDALNNIPKELLYLEPVKIDRKTTWHNQTSYSFVLSPHGNGLDCHRTWEALILGCIPIVKKSTIDELYDGLPVLIVDNWSNITETILLKTVEKFTKSTFDYEKLELKYWIEKMRKNN
jgi:hypothetical protein